MSAEATTPRAAIVKRSLTIAGHRTSVSLEDAFWRRLKALAASRRRSLGAMIAEIDAARDGANLSSAIRVYVLENSASVEAGRGRIDGLGLRPRRWRRRIWRRRRRRRRGDRRGRAYVGTAAGWRRGGCCRQRRLRVVRPRLAVFLRLPAVVLGFPAIVFAFCRACSASKAASSASRWRM